MVRGHLLKIHKNFDTYAVIAFTAEFNQVYKIFDNNLSSQNKKKQEDKGMEPPSNWCDVIRWKKAKTSKMAP